MVLLFMLLSQTLGNFLMHPVEYVFLQLFMILIRKSGH